MAFLLVGCSSLCPPSFRIAAVYFANPKSQRISHIFRAPPNFYISDCGPDLVSAGGYSSISASVGYRSFSGRFLLVGYLVKYRMQQDGSASGSADGAAQAAAATAAAQAQAAGALQEQVDRMVRQRLEQALGSVFGKVLSATERAAQAAEAQAASEPRPMG